MPRRKGVAKSNSLLRTHSQRSEPTFPCSVGFSYVRRQFVSSLDTQLLSSCFPLPLPLAPLTSKTSLRQAKWTEQRIPRTNPQGHGLLSCLIESQVDTAPGGSLNSVVHLASIEAVPRHAPNLCACCLRYSRDFVEEHCVCYRLRRLEVTYVIGAKLHIVQTAPSGSPDDTIYHSPSNTTSADFSCKTSGSRRASHGPCVSCAIHQ